VTLALFNATGAMGGGERFMWDLAEQLDHARYRPVHFCAQEGVFADRLRSRGWPVETVDVSSRLSIRSIRNMAALCRRYGVTLLHSAGARANLYGRLAARLAGVPAVISTVHTSLYAYEVNPATRLAYVWVERATHHLSDRVLVTSQAMYDDVLLRYRVSPTKLVLVRNGLAPQAARSGTNRAAVRASLALTPDQPVIGCIARMTEQKGHRYLLACLPDLLRAFPTLRCLLIGDGPLRSELERDATAAGVAHACLFLGEQKDLAGYYEAMDVVVLPSVSEGIPYVLLEAMGAGRPIVATRVGGIPEVAEHERSALLVDSRSSGQLAAAVAALLRDAGLAERLGEGARLRVRRFSSADMARDVERVYSEVLRTKGILS
jgi:glycosyltransferase involved in cell wall biosynthesis